MVKKEIKKLRSIGLFLHFEKPGQLALTKDRLIYAINLDNDEISNFFMKLKENLIEIDNRLDFFVPLGSSGKSINQNLFLFSFKHSHSFIKQN